MTSQFLEEAKRELTNGHSKRKHPFRYFTLATNTDNKSRLRTVVLRKFLSDSSLLFYTDARTPKVSEIKDNSNVSALFYHPKKLMQIRVQGKAEIINDPKLLKSYWGSIPEKSRKDYITKSTPGSMIENPDNVDYLDDDNHFCAIKIFPLTIEYLRLKRPNHLRILFTNVNGEWDGQFLVP